MNAAIKPTKRPHAMRVGVGEGGGYIPYNCRHGKEEKASYIVPPKENIALSIYYLCGSYLSGYFGPGKLGVCSSEVSENVLS
jgi:hypothetical protein